MTFREQFEAARALLPPTSDRELDLYVKHFEHLLEWNEKISLVSRKTVKDSFAPHYADSLFIADFVNRHCPKGVVHDIGTGAGFPGMVIAIRNPDRRVCLYEKLQKKQKYLESAVATLDLKNTVLNAGFERLTEAAVITARAVMPREELLAFLSKAVPVGSKLIANLGGQSPSTEPKGFRREATERYSLPGGFGDRVVELLVRCST